MRKLITPLIVCLFCCSAGAAEEFIFEAYPLRLGLDSTGRITKLEDIPKKKNYNFESKGSFLLECKTFKSHLKPSSMKVVKRHENSTWLQFGYQGNIKITVRITQKEGYLRMEVVEATPLEEIAMIQWGPIRPTMNGPAARWIGLARSDDFTIGLMPLESNTGNNAIATWYQSWGTELHLSSYNLAYNNRSISDEYKTDYLNVTPLPGVAVVGSAVALLGCRQGRDDELDIIEAIELAEGLPHPMYKGKWVKRSKEVQRPSFWTSLTQKNMDEAIKVAKEMGCGQLVRLGGVYRNWGHYEIDPGTYSGGWDGLRDAAKKCTDNGLQLAYYTFTYFLQPKSAPEPYISPVPDPRLASFKMEASLADPVGEQDTELSLVYSKEIEELWGKFSTRKVIQVDHEMIEGTSFEVNGQKIILKQLTRGAFMGKATAHTPKSPVRIMLVRGYHSFFPGTVGMHEEIARRQAEIVVNNGLGLCILDGFGEATGHGSYAKSRFMEICHDTFVKNGREVIITSSPSQSLFNWHCISYFSWGEFEEYKGFRGTMLDYRLERQVQLRDNLLPRKLGQYYPEKATAEDIEWLMGLVAGWDSGVDLAMGIDKMQANPDYQKICEVITLWETAKMQNVFTEQQKLALRQTDTIHTLTRKEDGTFELKFKKFWRRREGFTVLPSSEAETSPLSGGANTVKKCSIDWSWTHSPAAEYAEGCISDDMIHSSGNTMTTWRVKSLRPNPKNTRKDRKLSFVIRLPKDAPCGVRNIRISWNDQVAEIPATLQPGQYLSKPHDIKIINIYGGDHHVVGEVTLPQYSPYWYVGDVKKGASGTLGVSCDPIDPDAKVELLVNQWFFNEIQNR